MAVFVNTLRCRRCAIASPRRCIDARGTDLRGGLEIMAAVARPDSAPPPFTQTARCSFSRHHTGAGRLIKCHWRINVGSDAPPRVKAAFGSHTRYVPFSFFSALYRANDDYRYSESLRSITGDNCSARPILCSYFEVLENIHTHTCMIYQFVALCGIS